MGTSPKKKDSGEGGVTVEYGTVKALHAIAERIGLMDIINQAAPKRNGLPVGELAFIMAANRLLDRRPKYTIAEWYQRTYMPEIIGIDLPPDSAYQTLTRCLDYLTDDVQMEIEMALAARVMESFHLKPESFIYDVTSTFVEGEGGAEILQYGYSRDHRPDCRQVNYSLCVTMNPTVPLFHEAFPGNTVDSKTVKETMVRFKDKLGLYGCLVVDRGIVTSANIVEIVDERKLDLVGGLRMDRRFRALALKTSLKSFGKQFTLKDEALQAKEFTVDIGGNDRRCILYYSEEKAERDRKSRDIRLAKSRQGLDEIAASLTRKGAGRKPTRNGLDRRIVLLLEKRCADLDHVAEVPVRLPEVLAERQQDHMLVVRVQVIGVPRPSKRGPGPPQDPQLSLYDANQLMLVRLLPIPRNRAILSWNQDNSFWNWLDSREGPCCADVSTFPECRISEGFYTANLQKSLSIN